MATSDTPATPADLKTSWKGIFDVSVGVNRNVKLMKIQPGADNPDVLKCQKALQENAGSWDGVWETIIQGAVKFNSLASFLQNLDKGLKPLIDILKQPSTDDNKKAQDETKKEFAQAIQQGLVPQVEPSQKTVTTLQTSATALETAAKALGKDFDSAYEKAVIVMTEGQAGISSLEQEVAEAQALVDKLEKELLDLGLAEGAIIHMGIIGYIAALVLKNTVHTALEIKYLDAMKRLIELKGKLAEKNQKKAQLDGLKTIVKTYTDSLGPFVEAVNTLVKSYSNLVQTVSDIAKTAESDPVSAYDTMAALDSKVQESSTLVKSLLPDGNVLVVKQYDDPAAYLADNAARG